MALLETTGHEAPREEERESILTPRKYMFDGLTEPETLARDATSVLKERKQVNSLVFHSLSILWERNFAHWMVEFCFVLFWFGLVCFVFSFVKCNTQKHLCLWVVEATHTIMSLSLIRWVLPFCMHIPEDFNKQAQTTNQLKKKKREREKF